MENNSHNCFCISEFAHKNLLLSGHYIKVTAPYPWCRFCFLPCAFETFPIKNLDWLAFKILIISTFLAETHSFSKCFHRQQEPAFRLMWWCLLSTVLKTNIVITYFIAALTIFCRVFPCVSLRYLCQELRTWGENCLSSSSRLSQVVVLFFGDAETPLLPTSFQIQCVPAHKQNSSRRAVWKILIFQAFQNSKQWQKGPKILLQMLQFFYVEGSLCWFIQMSEWEIFNLPFPVPSWYICLVFRLHRGCDRHSYQILENR